MAAYSANGGEWVNFMSSWSLHLVAIGLAAHVNDSPLWVTPRTFAPKAAVTSLGGNDSSIPTSFFKDWKERARTPDTFVSEHSNVVDGRVLMDCDGQSGKQIPFNRLMINRWGHNCVQSPVEYIWSCRGIIMYTWSVQQVNSVINSMQRVTPEHNFRLGMKNLGSHSRQLGVILCVGKNVRGVINASALMIGSHSCLGISNWDSHTMVVINAYDTGTGTLSWPHVHCTSTKSIAPLCGLSHSVVTF